MPISHRIHSDLGLIVSTHVGHVLDEEFLVSYRTLFESAEFSSSYHRIVDLRQTDSRFRSADALREFASYFARHYEASDAAPKTAVVAPGDTSYGLARMYEAFTDLVPGEFAVFRTLDEALAWMQVPGDVAAGIIDSD